MYHREYLAIREKLITSVLLARGPPTSLLCATCEGHHGTYRCLECTLPGLHCQSCVLSSHSHLPFHRLEKWTGTHFEWCSLQQLGYIYYLGHGGSDCPTSMINSCNNEVDTDDSDNDEDEWGTTKEASTASPTSGTQIMTVVSTSGIHQVAVHWCLCNSKHDKYSQLMAVRLYPSTFTRPKTAFTWEVLDMASIDSTVCNTTANSFYQKLRYMTSAPNAWKLKVSPVYLLARPELTANARTGTES